MGEDHNNYEEGQYMERRNATETLHRHYEYSGSSYADNIDIKTPEDLYAYCLKEVGETKWKCGMCFQFSHMGRNQVRNHVESKHFPNTWQYDCKYCGNISKTKKALDIHMSVKHKNENF